MTISDTLEERTWKDDVLEGKISLIKFGGQTVIRFPFEMGAAVGKEMFHQTAHELFECEDSIYDGFYAEPAEYTRVKVYEIQLPSVRANGNAHGPDGADCFVQRILERYSQLIPQQLRS